MSPGGSNSKNSKERHGGHKKPTRGMTFQHLMKSSLLNKIKELKAHDRLDEVLSNDDKQVSTFQLTTYAQNSENNNSKNDLFSQKKESTKNVDQDSISQDSEEDSQLEKKKNQQDLAQISEEEDLVDSCIISKQGQESRSSKQQKMKNGLKATKQKSVDTDSFGTDSDWMTSPNNNKISNNSTPGGLV